MALDKPSLNDFLPNGFETQNKTDYKAGFSADKIAVGFEKDTLEVLSGPNLNDLLDKTGKNTHVLSDFLNYFKNMPIGSFPVVNTSNQLDYKSVNSFFRNVGELVYSLIPLEDENLRLLDGSLLENEIKTSRFISYIAGLRSTLPNLFTTEANWQAQVQQYGVCGKFVYNTTDRSLRLPKITGFVQGTNDRNSLGDLVEASIPQHTHNGTTESGGGSHDHGRGTMDITGATTKTGLGVGNSAATFSGAFSGSVSGNGNDVQGGSDNNQGFFNGQLKFQASNSWTGRTTSENIEHTHNFTTDIANNNVYKSGATTVQPQAIKAFIYIVVSIDEAEKQVLSAVYNYKGSVPTYADLPNDAAIGEVYNVIGQDPEGYSGANFAWTGEEWDRLGGTVNLTGYLTKVEAGNTYATKASLESNVDNLQEQINTNASNIANIASQEVIEQGIKKIEALKFSSTIGHGITNDVDLYSVIYRYAHSSFDKSKFTVGGNPFTVVGTPTITNDGMYSASENNWIRLNVGSLPSIWGAKFKVTTPTLPTTQANTAFYVKRVGNANAKIVIRIDNNQQRMVVGYFKSDGTYKNDTFNLTANTDYYFGVYVNGSNMVIKVDGESFVTATDLNTSENIEYIAFATQAGGTNFWTTPFDLKYLEVNIDGTIYSGNKTGIDTIKPDDYTVVGTPTISADGIASGFSASNYLTGATLNLVNKPFAFEFDTLYKAGGTQRYLEPNDPNLKAFICMTTGGLVNLNFGDGTTFAGDIIGRTQLTLNALHHIKVEWTGVKVNIYVDGALDKSADYDMPQIPEFVLRIGVGRIGGAPITGDIDLSSLKFYVGGNLVYQPCLKIPYTLSKTDLKITREMGRAIDMANQCDFSDYFGLNEQNNTCMIPQGDNISGRRTLVSRTEDSVTHYVTEIYSDLFCRQSGSGTASTPLTFAIPYKYDDTVKVSCPYSAKSKTGFTPTADCDWFAEGYIYLDEVI